MTDSRLEDPDLPAPGQRTGTGADSVLRFLRISNASKPRLPKGQDFAHTLPLTKPADLEPSPREKR